MVLPLEDLRLHSTLRQEVAELHGQESIVSGCMLQRCYCRSQSLVTGLTFPSSVAEVMSIKKSLSSGLDAYSASSRSTLVRGQEVMST